MPSHHYLAYGLQIESEINFTDLLSAENPTAAPDVVIRYARVPETISEPQLHGVLYRATQDHYLLTVPGVASFYVYQGRRIDIQRSPGATDSAIRLFLQGSPLAALLHQKGKLVFQASAIKAGSSAIAFAGCSGTGKSTIAAALAKRHYPLLTDEHSVIATGSKNGPCLWPGNQTAQLWRNACDLLDITPALHQQLRHDLQKYQIGPDRLQQEHNAVPLRTIYILSVRHQTRTKIETLTGRRKIQALTEQHNNEPLSVHFGSMQSTVLQIMQLAAQLEIKSLCYQRSPAGFEELINTIEADLPNESSASIFRANDNSKQTSDNSQLYKRSSQEIHTQPLKTQLSASTARQQSPTGKTNPDLVWMASYPKSGNTWLRAFLSNYLSNQDTPLDINSLAHNRQTGLIASQRQFFRYSPGSEIVKLNVRRDR